jgi:hypothetical protein
MVVGTVRVQQPLRESSEVSGKLVTECEVYLGLSLDHLSPPSEASPQGSSHPLPVTALSWDSLAEGWSPKQAVDECSLCLSLSWGMTGHR